MLSSFFNIGQKLSLERLRVAECRHEIRNLHRSFIYISYNAPCFRSACREVHLITYEIGTALCFNINLLYWYGSFTESI